MPVLGWNIQCAVLFILSPDAYSGGFNLSGESGVTVLRSLGLLFIMWNVPYLFAILRPFGWKICLVSAIIQQAIGLMGEIWIRSQTADEITRGSILRFIQFDGAGLVMLAAALILIQLHHRKEPHRV